MKQYHRRPRPIALIGRAAEKRGQIGAAVERGEMHRLGCCGGRMGRGRQHERKQDFQDRGARHGSGHIMWRDGAEGRAAVAKLGAQYKGLRHIDFVTFPELEL